MLHERSKLATRPGRCGLQISAPERGIHAAPALMILSDFKSSMRVYQCIVCLIFASSLCFVSKLRAEAGVRITEFMAANANGLRDEDGDASDWIEIYNAGPAAASLEGWYLTDSSTSLPRWRFPAIPLAANTYLVVFASGKNRAVPGSNLHASFKLNPAGGYLALVKQDAVTVASQFFYVEQFSDISFGSGLGPSRSLEALVGPGAPLKYLIPEATVEEAWRGQIAFNDASWTDGKLSVGFSTSTGAVTLAYSVPANTPGNQAFSGSLGMDFDVTQPVQVTELGCFDDSGNGIAAGTTITVQIWRRNNKGTPTVPTDDLGLGVIAKTNFTAAP